ncbi:MAG: hypothetical protein NZM12_10175, partial [Steroidobacteraceae bacterium]|nr:hypothetical protein [Steroidobacteraceae bacterium]
MNHEPPDDEFDRRLRQREPLLRAYPDDDELRPPEHLDRLVLQRARTALQAASTRAPRPFTLNQWALPLGLAVTLVIGIGVALQLGTHPAEPPPGATRLPIDTPRDVASSADAQLAAAAAVGDAPSAAATPAARADAAESSSAERM